MAENIFQIMTTAIWSKDAKLEDVKKIPSFLFCRWLSGNQYTLFAANMINQYYDIPIENQYQMIKKAFGGKIKFIKFPKGLSEKSESVIDAISQRFKVNHDLAREYLDFIDKKELDDILSMYSAKK